MKKSMLILAITPLFFGCGLIPEHPKWYELRIDHWADKEWACLNNPTYHYDADYISDVDTINEIYQEAKSEITICKDPAIEWKSSCEIDQDRQGDCDTCAIWLWRKLRDQGMPDNINGMMIIYFSHDEYHLVNAIKYGGTFLIMDLTEVLHSEPAEILNIQKEFQSIIWLNLFEYKIF